MKPSINDGGNPPAIDKQLEELLDLLYFMGRSKRCRSILMAPHFFKVRGDLTRIVKLFNLGRELRPITYKSIKVLHKDHGTDHWTIRLSADRIVVILNKDNWHQFEAWVTYYMKDSPGSAAGLMHKYPHVRLGMNYEM